MIFVDSNIPMYLVGTPHPNRDAAFHFLAQAAKSGQILVTNVEAFQEILHRFSAVGRRSSIRTAFELLTELVDRVFPIEMTDVETAARIVESGTRLQARDALHLAVMKRYGIGRILSFDRGFDGIAGIERLPG